MWQAARAHKLEVGLLVGLAFFLPLLEAPKNIFWFLYVLVWIANRARALSTMSDQFNIYADDLATRELLVNSLERAYIDDPDRPMTRGACARTTTSTSPTTAMTGSRCSRRTARR